MIPTSSSQSSSSSAKRTSLFRFTYTRLQRLYIYSVNSEPDPCAHILTSVAHERVHANFVSAIASRGHCRIGPARHSNFHALSEVARARSFPRLHTPPERRRRRCETIPNLLCGKFFTRDRQRHRPLSTVRGTSHTEASTCESPIARRRL